MTVSCEIGDAQIAGAVSVMAAEPAVKLSDVGNRVAVEGSLPSQPVVSIESLAVAYVIVLNSLAETLFEQTTPISGDVDSNATAHRRREVCVAVWAANRAALEASTFYLDERAQMLKLVWQRLLLHWHEFGGSNGANTEWLEARTAEYLHKRGGTRPIATATHIVETLIEAIGSADRIRAMKARVLSSLVNHRIVSDVHHFNDLKSRYRFI